MADSQFLKIVKELSWPERFIILFLFWFCLYAVFTTSKVENTTYQNVSIPDGSVITYTDFPVVQQAVSLQDGKVVYGVSQPYEFKNMTVVNASLTSVKSMRYSQNSLVPKKSVSVAWAILAMLALVYFIFSLLRHEFNKPPYIEIDEAIDIAQRKAEAWQKKKLLPEGKIYVGPYHLTKRRNQDDMWRIIEYIIEVQVENEEDNITELFSTRVDPWTKYSSGFTPIDGHLSNKDKCVKCGLDYDVLIVSSTDLQKFRRVKSDMLGKREGL